MPSNLQKERLRKLRLISIFQVDTISTTLELDGNTVECHDDALLEEDEERMSLLISRSCGHPMMNKSLCKELASYLCVEFSELYGIVSRSAEDVEAMLTNVRATSKQLLYEGRLMLSNLRNYTCFLLLILLYAVVLFISFQPHILFNIIYKISQGLAYFICLFVLYLLFR